MESDSSAKSLLSLFSSSNLTAFSPEPSRNFYKTSPSPTENISHEPERPRKKRRQVGVSGEWTCAEIRALETYKNLMKGNELDAALREVLLPGRSVEEIKLQLARVEKTIRERRGNRLQELQRMEDAEAAERERARIQEMDQLLGLNDLEKEVSVKEEDIDDSWIRQYRDEERVRRSLDQALGLIEESKEQQAKRGLDEALGLCKGMTF